MSLPDKRDRINHGALRLLWQQVYDDVLNDIRSGALAKDDRLPSEFEMAGWIAETEAERARHELGMRQPTAKAKGCITEADIKAIVDRLADLAHVLADADPDDKAEIFRQLRRTQADLQTRRATRASHDQTGQSLANRWCPRRDRNPRGARFLLSSAANSAPAKHNLQTLP
jgi:hypothetical protein